MRVLLTTDTIGGVWTFTRELTEGLLFEGHAVALVSFGRPPDEDQAAWAVSISSTHARNFYFDPCDLPLEWMQDNSAVHAEGMGVLYKIARNFDADILHSSQFCWGALPLSVPRLVTAHSDVMSWARACDPDLLRGSAWLDRYIALVQRGLDGADLVTVPTRWMGNALRGHFRVQAPLHVVANSRTIAAASSSTERKLQALTAGRLWDRAKGLASLLDIDPAIPILVAGENRFEDNSASPAGARLTALGALSEAGVLRVLRESSIYLATSIYEPFGLAPLEAALCGCAVIARDLPSFREVWGDAALYFVTSAELEQLLLRLKENPAALREAQRAATLRAQHYTRAAMTRQYVQLYNSLLAAREQELATHAA